jgi:hypothetical protein
VRYLADDALEGREAGSWGERCAGEYIAAHFRALGLEPVGPGGSYFQPFSVQMGSGLGRGSALSVAGRSLEVGQAWIPFGFSTPGSLSASLVYGGPGVSQPGAQEDPHAHLDLTGRIVVVEASDSSSAGGGTLTSDPHFKATVAAGRGAAGILVLLAQGASLPDLEAERRPSVRIPAAAVSGAFAQAVREAARAGAQAEMATAVEPRMVEVRNVVGLLPGSDPTLGREVVVVGAHFDHLGLGGDGSLAPDARMVHNGADDNASGTAAMMGAARRLAESAERPLRSVLFIAFTGEEKGLWGSGHYVRNPLLPLESTVAMVNMDMVGRLRDNTLTVYGTGTALEWPALVERVNQRQGEPFVLSPIPDGFGPSDQSSFYGAEVPVLHLFTNTHSEYHRPQDDWQLIDATGLERVTALVADITRAVAGSAARTPAQLTLVEAPPATQGGGMPAARGDSSAAGPGYGAYMGTIPDMTPQEFGVRITGVRENSPAEKAGLKAGDILVELGGTEIADLYAYTYALRAHRPGDEVTVVVVRDGQRVRVQTVLGRRE